MTIRRTGLPFPDNLDPLKNLENEVRSFKNLKVFDAIKYTDFLIFDSMKEIQAHLQQVHNTLHHRIYEGDLNKRKAYFDQEQLTNELDWSMPSLGLPSELESFKKLALNFDFQQNKEKAMIIANTQEDARKIRDFIDCWNMRVLNFQNYGNLIKNNGINIIPIMGIYYSHYNLSIKDIDEFQLAIAEVPSGLAKWKRTLESFSNLFFPVETEVNYVNYLEHYKRIPSNREALESQVQAANDALDHLQKLKEVPYELRSNQQDVEDNIRFLKSSVSQIDLNIHSVPD